MSRIAPPNRHPCVTAKLSHTTASGDQSLLVTYGLDDCGRVRSVFCSSFLAGSQMNVLAMDACKLMSLLLQHGYSAADLVDKMDKDDPSILGTIARGALETEHGTTG